MLLSEHVKDLALIKEAETGFGSGLNIITGETGAGKSLVIGSVDLALGGKAQSGSIRKGSDEASVELVFEAADEEVRKKLGDIGIEISDDDLVIMTRKVRDGRSIAKINGETVNASLMKQAATVLIDIHGQRDQLGLLSKSSLLRLLDRFGGNATGELLRKVAAAHAAYRETLDKIDNDITDPGELMRRRDLLRYEVNEIEEAALKPGEDEEVEERYRTMKNAEKIVSAMSSALEHISGSGRANAAELIGKASAELQSIRGLDKKTDLVIDQLLELESLTGDLSMDLGDRLRESEFSAAEFDECTARLDLINRLKSKYGNSYEEIMESLENKSAELQKLDDHDSYIEALKAEEQERKSTLLKACRELTKKRREVAGKLQDQMKEALSDLNFQNVGFRIDIDTKEDAPTASGCDTVSFMISMNAGEDLMPLEDVASGGELSRIMLALKTVIADFDDIPTLIFDEIDTGISGRTAEKVAEKLFVLSKRRQVIAITHLPQIAAMADHHFVIEKTSDGNVTETGVRELKGEEPVEELSRLLSGAEITDAVRENAREMLQLAKSFKLAYN